MRLVTYQSDSGPRVAGIRDGALVDLNRTDPEVPSSIKALLARGADGLELARAALAAGGLMPAEDVNLLPPVPDPEKVICIGRNYVEHASESGFVPPREPIVFSKFPTALVADGDAIICPANSSQVDWEAELVVVIGTGGRHISQDQALTHVAGYMCGNDVSARDWQMGTEGGQWLLGKSFDTFAPIGPWFVTADEIPAPGNLKIRLRVNGQTMQDANTGLLIFPIEQLIHYCSQVFTLSPGDLIFTGTPSGIGHARTPPVFLRPGDVAEVEIEGIGTLRNPVMAEDPGGTEVS